MPRWLSKSIGTREKVGEMVASNLEAYRPELRRHEGGFSDHPRDPGGATNYGITQKVYDAWRVSVGLVKQTVRDITKVTVDAIYRERYWDKIKGDDLPAGIDTCTFDAAVNSGVKQGAKWTQRALGVSADGKIGPLTVEAAKHAPNKPAVIKDACRRRLSMLQGLRHWADFKNGWSRRVAEVEAFSVNLALQAMKRAPESIRAANQNEVEDADRSRKRNDAAAGTAGTITVADGAVVVDRTSEVPEPTDGAPDLVLDAVWLDWVVGGLLVAGLIAVAFFIWRAHVQKQRRNAYRLASSGGLG